MADRRNLEAKEKRTLEAPERRQAVGRAALSIVPDFQYQLDDVLFENLFKATLGPDPETCRRAIVQAISDGAQPEELADFYIPALARRMGDQWCVDALSFAGVTIGVSRLQAMLRSLGPNWSGDKGSLTDAPSVLLVVPQEIYHTLGAIVLSGQLRRKGFSVKLVLGGRPKDVVDLLNRAKFNAVFISSSQGQTLESLHRLIVAVRSAAKDVPPVVIGGSILEIETANDVTALTGADHATKNLDEAVRLCGLRVASQRIAQAEHRT